MVYRTDMCAVTDKKHAISFLLNLKNISSQQGGPRFKPYQADSVHVCVEFGCQFTWVSSGCFSHLNYTHYHHPDTNKTGELSLFRHAFCYVNVMNMLVPCLNHLNLIGPVCNSQGTSLNWMLSHWSKNHNSTKLNTQREIKFSSQQHWSKCNTKYTSIMHNKQKINQFN